MMMNDVRAPNEATIRVKQLEAVKLISLDLTFQPNPFFDFASNILEVQQLKQENKLNFSTFQHQPVTGYHLLQTQL